jgi:hypothetical protein
MAGFQTHVPKPVDPIELAMVVSHLAVAHQAPAFTSTASTMPVA